MQRVKVYKLNSDGLWDDKGTGHVSVEFMEVSSVAFTDWPLTGKSHKKQLFVFLYV